MRTAHKCDCAMSEKEFGQGIGALGLEGVDREAPQEPGFAQHGPQDTRGNAVSLGLTGRAS